MPSVLVTGASRGIGKTIATHLAANGWDVVAGVRTDDDGIAMSQRMAVPPEKVAAVVEEALTARHPRARYVVGFGPKLQLALLNRMPTRLRDRVLRAVAKQPG